MARLAKRPARRRLEARRPFARLRRRRCARGAARNELPPRRRRDHRRHRRRRRWRRRRPPPQLQVRLPCALACLRVRSAVAGGAQPRLEASDVRLERGLRRDGDGGGRQRVKRVARDDLIQRAGCVDCEQVDAADAEEQPRRRRAVDLLARHGAAAEGVGEAIGRQRAAEQPRARRALSRRLRPEEGLVAQQVGLREGGELAELSLLEAAEVAAVGATPSARVERVHRRASPLVAQLAQRAHRRAAHDTHVRAPPRRRRQLREVGGARRRHDRRPALRQQRRHARRLPQLRRHAEQHGGRPRARAQHGGAVARTRAASAALPPASAAGGAHTPRSSRSAHSRLASSSRAPQRPPLSPLSPTSTQAPSSRAVAARQASCSGGGSPILTAQPQFSGRRRHLLELWHVREQHVDGGWERLVVEHRGGADAASRERRAGGSAHDSARPATAGEARIHSSSCLL